MKILKFNVSTLLFFIIILLCNGCTTSEKTPTITKPNEKIKIGLVTLGTIHDESYNENAWEGMQRAHEELGFITSYLEAKNEKDYIKQIKNMIQKNYNLIFLAYSNHSKEFQNLLTENPKQKFVIIGDSFFQFKNTTNIIFKQNEVAYLVGIIAGKMTETNHVGLIQGMNSPNMNEFGYGYVAGILNTNPNITLDLKSTECFSCPEIGKSTALKMYENGCDVIFHVAGDTGTGVIQAAKEKNLWVIGADKDQNHLAPKNVLTSVLKRVDIAIFLTAKHYLEGTLQSGTKIYDFSNQGISLAPSTDKNCSDKLLSYVQEVKMKIQNKEIKIPQTKEEFESIYGDKIFTLD